MVQQSQGRVKPTGYLEGHVPLNADETLEREADAMGAKAARLSRTLQHTPPDAVVSPSQGVASDGDGADRRPHSHPDIVGRVPDRGDGQNARVGASAILSSEDGRIQGLGILANTPGARPLRSPPRLEGPSAPTDHTPAGNTLGPPARATNANATTPPVAGASGAVLQRYLIVGDKDVTRWYKEMAAAETGADKDTKIRDNLNNAITTIAVAMIGSLDTTNVGEAAMIEAIKQDNGGKLRAQLAKWIKDEKGTQSGKSHPTFGAKSQTRVYDTPKDLTLALLGWVNAKTRRHQEKDYAREIQANDAVSYHIDSVLLNINAKIEGAANKNDIRTHLSQPTTAVGGKIWGTYKYYFANAGRGHGTLLPDDFNDVLNNPGNYDVRQKTGVLHDLMQYFYDRGENTFIEANPNMQATELQADGVSSARVNYNRPKNSQIRDQQMDGGLVKPEHVPGAPGGSNPVEVSQEEQHASYKFARKHNLPMYGRHSYTAARMISVAQKTGATKEQMSAVAWATMSYWRLNYDHTSIPYHTLHEIMDFLPSYGIDYDPMNAEQGKEVFSDENFIETLKRDAKLNMTDRDFQKFINKAGSSVATEFFLNDNTLWANGVVGTFLSNTMNANDISTFAHTNGYFRTAEILLSNNGFFSNQNVLNFLMTTVLPDDEFLQLDPGRLREFFNYNEDTRNIFAKIPENRQQHVRTGV